MSEPRMKLEIDPTDIVEFEQSGEVGKISINAEQYVFESMTAYSDPKKMKMIVTLFEARKL